MILQLGSRNPDGTWNAKMEYPAVITPAPHIQHRLRHAFQTMADEGQPFFLSSMVPLELYTVIMLFEQPMMIVREVSPEEHAAVLRQTGVVCDPSCVAYYELSTD